MSQKISIPVIWLFIFLTAANGQQISDYTRTGIVNGKAIVLPKPEYPSEAKEFCAGGKVEVDVLIDEKGDVIEAKAISGDELLYATSVKAVKGAKFSQSYNGAPVKIRGIVVYNFDSLAPKCITVGIVNQRALKIPKPTLNIDPPKQESIMAVQIVVDPNGEVTAARALSGHPLLRGAAVAAARQTKFSAVNVNGQPVKVKALLVYKIKPNASVETNIASDDKAVIGTPVSLVEPPVPFCNCKFGGKISSVLVEIKTDERGNVVQAKAFSGHPVLKNISEKAALGSKFLSTGTKAKILLVYNFVATDESAREVKFKDIEVKKVEIEK